MYDLHRLVTCHISPATAPGHSLDDVNGSRLQSCSIEESVTVAGAAGCGFIEAALSDWDKTLIRNGERY